MEKLYINGEKPYKFASYLGDEGGAFIHKSKYTDLRKAGHDVGLTTTPKGQLEVVALDPNKVKSANAITYDDAGNIIPLSKRDNFTIPDIRYGILPFIGLTSINNE